MEPLNNDDHLDKLEAWARVNLGMLRGEFRSLEPREFFFLVDAWQEKDRRARINFAQVCLTIASSSGAKTVGGEPLTLGYFLGEKPPVKPRKGKRRSLKQQFIDSLPPHFRPTTNGNR